MAASYLRKYGAGTGADIYINIPKAGSANHAVGADWTPAAGDVKISKDGGAAANIGTLPTAVAMGNSAIWKFVFADAELQAAFISVTVADSATKAVDDTGFSIETYGNASGQHAFDLDTASTAQTGDSFARLGAPAGASVSADILAIDNLVDDLESRVGTPADLGGGATLSANLSDIEAQTDDIGAAGAGLTSIPNSAGVTTLLSRVGTPSDLGSGATVAANLVDIEAQTDDIGAAGAGLTALATQASVNTIDDFLDTEIAAIKAKTDSLTFTVANQLDANVQSINDVTVQGTGVTGDLWRG